MVAYSWGWGWGLTINGYKGPFRVMEKSSNGGLWWWVYNSVNLLKTNWVVHLVDKCYVNYILVKLKKKSVTRFKRTLLRSFCIMEEIFHFFFYEEEIIFHDGITEEFTTFAKGRGGSGSNASDGEWLKIQMKLCSLQEDHPFHTNYGFVVERNKFFFNLYHIPLIYN